MHEQQEQDELKPAAPTTAAAASPTVGAAKVASDADAAMLDDTSGHVATEPNTLHSLSLTDLEAQVAAAGVLISRRQLMRHCEAGTFDAKKLPATNNVKEWFIAPASVEKGVGDIKTLQARRDASRRDTSDHDASPISPKVDTDMSSHDGTRQGASDAANNGASNIVMAGHVRSQPDTSKPQPSQKGSETQPVMARHDATELDVYEHPYVKKLEERVEKLEAKYETQVRRTEEIQLKGQAQLLELQRMTAVGQSKTLANFMLKARHLMFGAPTETEEREATNGGTPT